MSSFKFVMPCNLFFVQHKFCKKFVVQKSAGCFINSEILFAARRKK